VFALGPGGRLVRLAAVGGDVRAGLAVERFRGAAPVPSGSAADRPQALPVAEVARLNGGRLPLGLGAAGGDVPVTYRSLATVTVWLDTSTDRVIDLLEVRRVVAQARTGGGSFALPVPVQQTRTAFPSRAVGEAAAAARDAHDAASRRTLLLALAVGAAVVGGLGLLVAALGRRAGGRGRAEAASAEDRVPAALHS
jgi:hypothetical protein